MRAAGHERASGVKQGENMDISQAKEQIRKTCIAYLTKDEFGDYVVPVETQRPVFLVGA